MKANIFEVPDKKSFLVNNRKNLRGAVIRLNKARDLAIRSGLDDETAQAFVVKYPRKSLGVLVNMAKGEKIKTGWEDFILAEVFLRGMKKARLL